ncbi:MAG: LTA synthase family protein [Gemmatimonadaceae bacterium]|nr:LTA synthase family protein [Gemmatimonadaceae bacterium]
MRTLLFWLVWFTLARALFVAWHWQLVPASEQGQVTASFLHGARMDLSAAAYLTALHWLVLSLTVAAPAAVTRWLLAAVTTLSTAFVTIITLSDIGTFGAWRHRIDASLWTFLGSPREAYASASSTAVGPLAWLLAMLLPLTLWLHLRVTRGAVRRLAPVRGLRVVPVTLGVIVTGLLLVLPIRGGWQWTPLNESTVAFSHSEIANMAAQNAGWTLLSTTIADSKVPTTNPYAALPEADARWVVDSLYPPPVAGMGTALLRVPRPNVILIVWESFTAKVVGRLGGRADVTPQFDRWSHAGILFDSVFASGDRSAQGLVSILSGFPSVPNEAIMTRPQKAAALPQLGRTLRGAGYRTSYYYGGELAFANMKAYLLHGGFDRLTGIDAFTAQERNSKWGAHDHVVLGRALRELASEPRPFFSTVFTLSSHEPFETPVPPVFPGDDESTQFRNAHHYTDASVGAFLDSASRRPWWDSTLVVLIADHGSPLPQQPGAEQESLVARHHIPMLWLGGALRVRDTVVHRIGSSVDLAPTLLGALGVAPVGFRWGQSLFRPGDDGFAWFSHGDGFSYVDRRGWVVYDERARRMTDRSPRSAAVHQRNGSALLQASFADYLTR